MNAERVTQAVGHLIDAHAKYHAIRHHGPGSWPMTAKTHSEAQDMGIEKIRQAEATLTEALAEPTDIERGSDG